MRSGQLTSGMFLGILIAGALLAWTSACGSRTGLVAEVSSLDDAGLRSDGALPLIDAEPLSDVVRYDCPDAAATLVYVVTEQSHLYSFNPPTGSFTHIGTLACPAPVETSPFSMAVDRKGVAYIVYNDGALYRVSTANAACTQTPFVAGQEGFFSFGMGFASNTNGPDETLFIAPDGPGSGAPRLGAIDVRSFDLTTVGAFSPPILHAELTGTGDGRLFAFYRRPGRGSAIGQIDKQTANVIAETPLPTVEQGTAWAFGFWGGDFYTFTSPTGTGSTVTRFRPADGTVTEVATLGQNIVGAGVSTCAPER